MKRMLLVTAVLGLVGCQTPTEVKTEPVAHTIIAEAPYKLLGACVQQRLQNDADSWEEMRLTFQDWVPSAELVYLQRVNLAGIVETLSVTTLKPEDAQTTRLTVQLNPSMFSWAVRENLTQLDNEVKACTALIQPLA